MGQRKSLYLVSILVVALLVTGCSSSPPTYPEVIKTYPKDVQPCKTDVSVERVGVRGIGGSQLYTVPNTWPVDEDGWTVIGTVEFREGKHLIKWYGAKVTLNVSAVLEGKNYKPGTKLTVDKDLKWIEVSSWD